MCADKNNSGSSSSSSETTSSTNVHSLTSGRPYSISFDGNRVTIKSNDEIIVNSSIDDGTIINTVGDNTIQIKISPSPNRGGMLNVVIGSNINCQMASGAGIYQSNNTTQMTINNGIIYLDRNGYLSQISISGPFSSTSEGASFGQINQTSGSSNTVVSLAQHTERTGYSEGRGSGGTRIQDNGQERVTQLGGPLERVRENGGEGATEVDCPGGLRVRVRENGEEGATEVECPGGLRVRVRENGAERVAKVEGPGGLRIKVRENRGERETEMGGVDGVTMRQRGTTTDIDRPTTCRIL